MLARHFMGCVVRIGLANRKLRRSGALVKEDLDSAARYRQRAEHLRTMVAGSKDPSATIILGIAEDYDRMARSRERIDTIERACSPENVDRT